MDEASPPPRQVPGPFEGYRLGASDVPLRIRDLSLEGCLVELSFGTLSGRTTRLQIDLPKEGWTILQCEMLHAAGHNTCAVRFIRLDEETRRRVERTIDRLLGGATDGRPGADAEASGE